MAETPSWAPFSARQILPWYFDLNAGRPTGFTSYRSFKRNAVATDHFFSNACPMASPSLGLVTVSEEDVPVYVAPSLGAEPVPGLDAGARHLDPRYDLKVLETTPNWVRVEGVAPTWPPGDAGWTGWVERKKIQRIETEDELKCLFVKVLDWKTIPAGELSSIHDTALQILHDDRRCNRIGRGYFLGSGQRFYFTCYPSDGGKPYHYWLSPLEEGRSFVLPKPIAENAAMNACQSELQKALRNKEILEGLPSRPMSYFGSGLTEVDSIYYLTLDYRLGDESKRSYCLVAPGRGPEITIIK